MTDVALRVERVSEHDKRTRNQSDWYSASARKNKTLSYAISLMLVVCGAMVGFLPVFSGRSELTLIDIIVSGLGAFIVILKGIERIWLPDEKWVNYRKASEALLREKEMYIEGVGPYENEGDEDKAYIRFVQRSVLIKSEEQNNFWGLRNERDLSDNEKNT